MKMIGRRGALARNTVCSILYQLATVVCGLVLPRLILRAYGSELNGLVSSITQFLGIIGFLELGVGAVIQSSLYKPLSTRDNIGISKIIVSGQRFFSRLGLILLFYVMILIGIYPYISNQSFNWIYTATLIAAMSISSFCQYYFGVTDRLLLTADQRGYIQYNAQTITLVANTLCCALFIYFGFSIHIVKLTTSLIYLCRPVMLRIYVNRHYSIDRKITYTGEPIKQKWNGIAQHVAAVVLESTDTIVLTVFSSLSNVSIYSVYYMWVYGIKQILRSATAGVGVLFGDMWAKGEKEKLCDFFDIFEWGLHNAVLFIFGCTGVLLVPFIQVYTNGITDANYVQPLFALLLTVAHAFHCLRLPYNSMIMACGKYKETQSNYIVSAALNLLISIITVKMFGLIGVALGTFVAMAYQTIWMAHYNATEMLKRPFVIFIKQLCIDILMAVCTYGISRLIGFNNVSVLSWFVMAVEVAALLAISMLIINLIFYKKRILLLIAYIRKGSVK